MLEIDSSILSLTTYFIKMKHELLCDQCKTCNHYTVFGITCRVVYKEDVKDGCNQYVKRERIDFDLKKMIQKSKTNKMPLWRNWKTFMTKDHVL